MTTDHLFLLPLPYGFFAEYAVLNCIIFSRIATRSTFTYLYLNDTYLHLDVKLFTFKVEGIKWHMLSKFLKDFYWYLEDKFMVKSLQILS